MAETLQKIDDQIRVAQSEALRHQSAIRCKKKELADTTLLQYGADGGVEILPRNEMLVRRTLAGHCNKIHSIVWSADSASLLSVSQDGKLIVWSPERSEKMCAVSLQSAWAMCCAYSPTMQLVAAGGLDNVCSVYGLHAGRGGQDGAHGAQGVSREQTAHVAQKPRQVLMGHTEFISACAFFHSDEQMLSASGDKSAILWGLETGMPIAVFRGHHSDITDMAAVSRTLFATVGGDATARIWDVRMPTGTGGVRIYVGHEGDINAVCVHSTIDSLFATAGDDGSCRVYDLRADRELVRMQPEPHVPSAIGGDAQKAGEKSAAAVTSVSFSRSGRVLFASYDKINQIVAWDVLRAERSGVLQSHSEHISAIAVSPDGNALASSSWDRLIKVWA